MGITDFAANLVRHLLFSAVYLFDSSTTWCWFHYKGHLFLLFAERRQTHILPTYTHLHVQSTRGFFNCESALMTGRHNPTRGETTFFRPFDLKEQKISMAQAVACMAEELLPLQARSHPQAPETLSSHPFIANLTTIHHHSQGHTMSNPNNTWAPLCLSFGLLFLSLLLYMMASKITALVLAMAVIFIWFFILNHTLSKSAQGKRMPWGKRMILKLAAWVTNCIEDAQLTVKGVPNLIEFERDGCHFQLERRGKNILLTHTRNDHICTDILKSKIVDGTIVWNCARLNLKHEGSDIVDKAVMAILADIAKVDAEAKTASNRSQHADDVFAAAANKFA